MEIEKPRKYSRKSGKKSWKKKAYRSIPKTLGQGSITAWVGDRLGVLGVGFGESMFQAYYLTSLVAACPEFVRLRNMYPNFRPLKYSASVYVYPQISKDLGTEPYTCKTVNLNFNASSFVALGANVSAQTMLDDINCRVAPPGEKIKVKKALNTQKNMYTAGDLAAEQWGSPLIFISYDNIDSSIANSRDVASIFWRVKFLFSNQFVGP